MKTILRMIGLKRKPLDYNHKRFDRLVRKCESPIEKAFWNVGYFELSKHGKFTPQVKVGPYRLDFALQRNGLNVAIELDGHDYHSGKKQRTSDYRRERDLQRRGWRVIRFTGSEIHRDASGCVLEVVRMLGGVA